MKSILCFGDSNTWGYIAGTAERYPNDVRWTGVMGKQLGSDFSVIEEGQNGRTTVWDDPLEGDKNGMKYLPPCLESHKPLDLVILMLGTNDLKARFSLTALDIAAGVERLVQIIMHSDCGPGGNPPKVLLIAPHPVTPIGDLAEMYLGGAKKSKQLANRYSQVAERSNCDFMDFNRIMIVDPVDGIHFTPETHKNLGLAMANSVISIISPR